MAVRGEGMYLYDSGDKQYLDMSGGAAVSCLGHGHPDIVRAVQEQAGKLAFAHTAFFTNEPQEDLAARLASRFAEKYRWHCHAALHCRLMSDRLQMGREFRVKFLRNKRVSHRTFAEQTFEPYAGSQVFACQVRMVAVHS